MNLMEQLQGTIGKIVGEVATGMPVPVNAVTEHQEFKNACVVAGEALVQFGKGECTGAQALEGGLYGVALIAEKVGKTELKDLITNAVPGVAGNVAAGVLDAVL